MNVDKVVLVPGICGSVLMDGGRTVWPGTPYDVLFRSYPEELVQRLIESRTITATDILREVPLTVGGVTLHHFDGYGRAIAGLEELGFTEAAGTLLPFAYDWRQDVRTTARKLGDFLIAHGSDGKKIGIVAHSMGGLVTRYLLECLGAPAGVYVSLVVLAATPHLGAPAALQNILGLRPEVFLSKDQCRRVVGNPDFPSAYQLLPRANVPVLLRGSAALAYGEENILDGAVGTELGLSSGSLAAAAALWAELPMMDSAWQPPCRYFTIAGNEQRTISANFIGTPGQLAEAVEEPSSGDGTVPLWSAASPRVPVRYVPAEHGSVLADRRAREVLRALLRPTGAAFDAPSGLPSVSVQAIVPTVTGGDVLPLALVCDRATSRLEGELVIETLVENGPAARQSVPVSYQGGPLRSLAMNVLAPSRPSVLRLAFSPRAHVSAGSEAVVLVQQEG